MNSQTSVVPSGNRDPQKSGLPFANALKLDMVNSRISVVIPCYNEQDNIAPLIQQIHDALEPCSIRYEIVFVDDASTDATQEVLAELAACDQRVRYIRHRRNFGQSAALLSGIYQSSGNIIITLDADLQNDPADIPELLSHLNYADAVCGVRESRKDTAMKRLSSKIANRVRRAILDDDVLDAGCCFRVIKRDVLKQLPAVKSLHRFIPTILKIYGYNVAQIPVRHNARLHGYSKYGVSNRLFVGLWDLVGILWYKNRHIPPERY